MLACVINNYRRLCLIIFVMGFLSSCSTSPMRDGAGAASDHPAVVSLVEKSEQHLMLGHLPLALDVLERAVRIEPSNSYLWLSIAEVYRMQNRTQEAKNFAQRALSFSSEGSRLQRKILSFLKDLDES